MVACTTTGVVLGLNAWFSSFGAGNAPLLLLAHLMGGLPANPPKKLKGRASFYLRGFGAL
jgi:hypothetical protein